jgi:hypothetical protein
MEPWESDRVALSGLLKGREASFDVGESLVDTGRDVSSLHEFAGDGACQGVDALRQVAELAIDLLVQRLNSSANFPEQAERVVVRFGHDASSSIDKIYALSLGE